MIFSNSSFERFIKPRGNSIVFLNFLPHYALSDSRHMSFIFRSGVPPRKAIVGSPAAADDLPSSDEESSSDDDKSRIVSPAKEVSSNDAPNISFQV